MSNESASARRPLEPRQCAIVVGASSGMGAELARILVRKGYSVALVARREAMLAELCESINATANGDAQAYFFTHDVTNFDETASLFQRITVHLGGLDLIVYTAGAQPSMTPEEYDFGKDAVMTKVNLMGAMAWLGQAAFRFERAGGGHIVAISSIAGDRGRRLNPGYNASKAGLDTYLEGLRNRLSRHGVSVTTIKPGFVETAKLANAPKTMWVISPTEAAEQIYRAVDRKKQTAYVPARWRYVGLVIRHIPSVIFRRLNI